MIMTLTTTIENNSHSQRYYKSTNNVIFIKYTTMNIFSNGLTARLTLTVRPQHYHKSAFDKCVDNLAKLPNKT